MAYGSTYGGRGPAGLRAVTGLVGAGGNEALASTLLTFGTVIYGLSRAAALAQKSLDGMANRVDQILVKQGPDINVATKAQDVADFIQDPPGRTSWLGRGLRTLGKDLTPTGLFDTAQNLIESRIGPKPESLTNKAIDQLTPAELTEALTVPTLTKAQSDAVRKRLGQISGHTELEARGQQSYDVAHPSVTNIHVNAPVGDRNSVGLSVRAALDARDRNNGRLLTTTFTRG